MQSLWLLDVVSGRRVPVHADADGRLLANPDTRRGAPIAVITLPKAGTYFVARLLEQAGYVSSGLHVSQTFASDYRVHDEPLEEGQDPVDNTMHLPIHATALLVGPGQFFVGHLPWNEVTVPALQSFKKIFVKRELAACAVSALRFMIEKNLRAGSSWMELPTGPAQMLGFLEDVGAEFFHGNYALIVPWADDPSVFTVSYEALMGDYGEEARRALLAGLGEFLNLDGIDLHDVLLNRVVGQPTFTLSSGRTDLSQYWSEDVRREMIALGLNALNERLGYPAV